MIESLKKIKIGKFVTDKIPLVILFFLIFPFIILCFYAHPSGDDFMNARDVLDRGLLGTNVYYYKLASGRYFSQFITTALNPLVYKQIWFVKIFYLFNFSLFIYSIYFFINKIFRNHIQSSFITAIVLFNLLYSIPSTAEAFYWMAGAATYILPCSLLLFWNSIIITGFRTTFTFFKKISLLLLGIMIIGSNEIIMLIFFINYLFIIATIIKLKKKKLNWVYLILGVYLVFILVVIFSPGNHTKQIVYGSIKNHPIIESIQLTIINTFNLLAQLIKNSPLLLTNIILISFLSFYTKFEMPISPLYFFVLYVVMIFLALLPVYYSVGNMFFGRTNNILVLFIILGWFLLLVITFLHYRINVQTNNSFKVIISILIFSLILISLRQKNNITIAYADIIKGRASGYNRTLNERYEFINKSNEGAYLMVDSISIVPKTIFFSDITSDSTWWATKAYSDYFKRKIILKKKDAQNITN